MAISQPLDYNSTSPAAASNNVRNTWVADAPSTDPTVLRKVGTQTPFATATAAGAVPTPPNDATKYLDGTMNFSTPSGGGGGGSSVLFSHETDEGSSGSSETDLYSDSIAANTLLTAGSVVIAEYGGTFVNSGTTKELKAYFGGTVVFDSTALSISATSYWNLKVTLVAEGSGAVRAISSLTAEGASLDTEAQYVRVTGLTLSSPQTLKITGTGTTTNDITANAGVVWQPNGNGGGSGSSPDSGPSSTKGCILWVSGDTITGLTDGQAVTSWLPQVVNASVTGVFNTNCPVYKASILNGLPVVRFDGTGWYEGIFPEIISAHESSLFLVINFANLSPGYTGLFSAASGGWGFYVKSNGKTAFYATGGNYDGSGSATLVTGTWYIVTLIIGPQGLLVRVALANDFTSSSQAYNNGATSVRAGLANDVGSSGRIFTGDIAEVVGYRKALGATDMATVENYLKTKYGL